MTRTKYTPTCPTCEQQFSTRDYRQRYCSESCYHESRRGRVWGGTRGGDYWDYVNKGETPRECWLWMGGRDKDGYGIFRSRRAHRIAWELAHGAIPDDLHVLHNCPDGDNPACVNPAHLWLGTHVDNMKDRSRKGRVPRPRGEQNGRAKLCADSVREIRRCVAEGASRKEVAAYFGVGLHAISKVVLGRTWSHIE